MRGGAATRLVGRWLDGRLIGVASVSSTLALWEWYGRGVDPIFFSYPTAIARAFPAMIQSGELQAAVTTSLQALAIGWASATAAGVICGLVMGRYPVADGLLRAQILALYSTPRVALIPLLILWFGLDLEAKVAVVFLSAFFPVALNTRDGVRDVSPSLIEIADVEGAREWQVLQKLVVPAALPFVLTGVRISVGRAVVGMIVAEMFTAIAGLGGLTVLYANRFATDRLLAVALLLALLGLLLTEAVTALERLILPWKESERATR